LDFLTLLRHCLDANNIAVVDGAVDAVDDAVTPGDADF